MDYERQILIKVEREILISEKLVPLREILKDKKKTCVVVCPDKKYVDYIENVIENIKKVMVIYNIEVKTLSDTVKSQESNFQTILQLLKDCILGIVILDGLRPNVVLEYGILLCLTKPIIVLKDKNAKIDIEGLDDNLKDNLKKRHITNPKLDIDKHLSDVKDLHWTSYDWKSPDDFKENLQHELIEIKDKIILQIIKPMISEEIKNLSPEHYANFQKEFSELAEYIIRFIEPDYGKIDAIDKKIRNLAKQDKVKLHPAYYFELGNVYYSLSEYNKAIEFFDKAIEIEPDHASAWYNKGVALSKLGRYDEELKAYDKAIEIKPDHASACWYNKACAYSLKRDKENALKSLSKAIELNPEFKKMVKRDEDFKEFRDDEDFKKILSYGYENKRKNNIC